MFDRIRIAAHRSYELLSFHETYGQVTAERSEYSMELFERCLLVEP